VKERLPKYFAEAFGTFCLVFIGTGAICTEQVYGGLGSIGVSLAFGLVVLAMVYSVGHISGAHINPAVSVGFAAVGLMAWSEAWAYIAAQLGGAVAASLILRLIFAGTPEFLGATLPAAGVAPAFAVEFILTAILMFVIKGVAVDNRAQGVMAGVAIGAVITMAALFGGPLSGASMNPARSFAPALVSGQWSHQWLYWLAPLLGAPVGAWAYRLVKCPQEGDGAGCC
jgi:MIP family channel proteins